MGHGDLVGRATALRTLGSALGKSEQGRFQLTDLAGEPGIGKSRLLIELARRARDRGLVVLAGRAAEFEQDAPFAGIVDALDDHLRERVARVVARLSDAETVLLGSVFPALGAGEVPSQGVARYRLYRAVRSLIEVLAEPSGLVLILDDVHWADESSIELLDYLVRHPPRGGVMVAVAYRPAQVSARLTAALAGAAPGQRVPIPVEPLSAEEMSRVIGPAVSVLRRRWLVEASGGNPFHLEALARLETFPELGSQDGFTFTEGVLPGLPTAVHAALRVELNQVSPDALVIAHSAAVAGDEFEAAVLVAAAQIPADRTLSLLDELLGRDIVRESGGGRFRFRHPLVRHAAYASASAAWRLAAHGRIAAYLQRLDAPAAMVAHHVARSAGFGDRDSARVLAEAAKAVAHRAPATAEYWLTTALRLLPETRADAEYRTTLMIKLTEAQWMGGRVLAGRDTARAVLGQLPSGDHARRVGVAKILALLERLAGHPDRARELLADELSRFGDPASFEAVPLHLRLAVEHVWSGQFDDARRSLASVSPVHLRADQGIELSVASLRPMIEYASGNMLAALSHLDHAGELLAAASDEHVATWMDAVTWLCWAHLMVGRYREAVSVFSRTLQIARDNGQHAGVAPLLCGLARGLAQLGELEEGIAYAEEAVDHSMLLRSDMWTTVGLTFQSLLVSWTGDRDTAMRLAERADRFTGDSHEWFASLAHCARGLMLAQSGAVDEASMGITAALDDLESYAPDQMFLLVCCDAMAQAELNRGRTETAVYWAKRARATARPELACDDALAGLVEAHALSVSDPAAAVRLAESAAQVLDAAGQRLDAGRAWLRAGLSYAAAGSRKQALVALGKSSEAFSSCGAPELLAEATRARRKLGARIPGPRGPRNSLPYGLSAREWQIARLVAEGHTNQRIAEQLFLSIRTVETHLSHIFRKLDVTSRVGVSRVLGPMLGVPPSPRV